MIDQNELEESTSAEAKVKLDPLKYKWYMYDGRPAQFKVSADFEFELKKGETFGLKKVKGNYFLLDGSYLYVQFKLKEADAKRILGNAKSYSGKVGKITVQPGTEAGKDRKRLVVEELVEVRCDSSMLQELWYDKKKEILYVKFPNGAEWKYLGVTAEEVGELEKSPSQGKYFNANIKAVKDAERFEHDSGTNHISDPAPAATKKSAIVPRAKKKSPGIEAKEKSSGVPEYDAPDNLNFDKVYKALGDKKLKNNTKIYMADLKNYLLFGDITLPAFKKLVDSLGFSINLKPRFDAKQKYTFVHPRSGEILSYYKNNVAYAYGTERNRTSISKMLRGTGGFIGWGERP